MARAPFLDMSAISDMASLTELHGRGRLGLKKIQMAFWGVRGIPMSFLGMCLAFRDSDVERINSRNSARASWVADYICSQALLRG